MAAVAHVPNSVMALPFDVAPLRVAICLLEAISAMEEVGRF